ncbi:cupin domain-containing protein [Acidiphilium sp. AL]|uniref:Cupin domain-containing protein n=1 Tax=Acidiphilium iwatense TaxID=768198 RepID=A0ABS9E071_9PROT|nr:MULTISPECIES: cupin domain-containing protein [Acidiphilium]MCF3948343.1 cupin domain-containing protein [Acidiphilium iwatense]MCU4161284.1 cupin domain-containing protein [Acidiphilium sp. AL]
MNALAEITDPDDAERALGPLIRNRRQHLKLTLAQVADRVGLSIGLLSQVERGLSTPTIRQLQGIASALGVRIGWFFQSEDGNEVAEIDIVVRAPNRRKIAYRDLGMTDELLVPNLDGKLGLLMCRLLPGASSGGEPYAHEGDEAGLLLSGTLEIEVNGRVFVLHAGDSFAFQSTSPHRYRNPGDVEAVIVWALTPPSF